jgi:MFS family permease
MVGNILSVALWVAATDFRTFLASRIVGGLSEGNVQIAMAIATDISDDSQRGATMALVGVCFSIAFTFGPALGAYLSTLQVMTENPFAMAAGFSLFLIVTETIYLYVSLPETLPSSPETSNGTANGHAKSNEAPKALVRTNSHTILNATHFTFILFFSGMEFSLPFMTYDLFAYQAKDSGKLLGFIGLVASLLQGSVVRRMHPLKVVQMGVVSAAIAFIMLGRVQTQGALYAAAALLAVTSATVVTGLNSLSSFEASAGERGNKLGNHRSFGEFYATSTLQSLLTINRTSWPSSWTFGLLHTILVGRTGDSIRNGCCRYRGSKRTSIWWPKGTARHGERWQEDQAGSGKAEVVKSCIYIKSLYTIQLNPRIKIATNQPNHHVRLLPTTTQRLASATQLGNLP